MRPIAVVAVFLALATFGCAHAPEPAKATTSPSASVAPGENVRPKPVRSQRPSAQATSPKCGNGKPLRVHFYNVGQALSVLVTFPDGTHWLVDAGTGADGTKARLPTSFRKDLNDAPLDLIWITHQHADHLNAAEAILEKFKVKAYVDNGEDVEARPAKAASIYLAATGKLPTPDAPVKVVPFLPSTPAHSCPSNPNNCPLGSRQQEESSGIALDCSNHEKGTHEHADHGLHAEYVGFSAQ